MKPMPSSSSPRPPPSGHSVASVQRDALADLYVDHHGWLQGWLSQRLGDRHQAGDLAHDTFLRLLAKQEAITIREPRALLATIAQRVLANHWRRRYLERAYLDAIAREPEALAPSEEERAILVETLLEVDRILDGLSGPVRRAFLMSQLDGMRHAQIAHAMGISLSSVKRYLTQAAQHCYFADLAFEAAR